MDEQDLNLYIIAELRYKKEHLNENDESIFPVDWYSNRNYKLKTEIIAEAIKNKTIIENTNLYHDKFIEGVRSKQ